MKDLLHFGRFRDYNPSKYLLKVEKKSKCSRHHEQDTGHIHDPKFMRERHKDTTERQRAIKIKLHKKVEGEQELDEKRLQEVQEEKVRAHLIVGIQTWKIK